MNNAFRSILFIVSVVPCLGGVQGQSTNPGSNPVQEEKKVPVIDGGVGPCSLELKVLGPDGKPAYAATVKVHIAYGFGGFRRLDLQAGTNSDGKVKFTGLPDRVKRPPLEFRATKDDLEGMATDDPATECHANHEIRLEKPSPTPAQ